VTLVATNDYTKNISSFIFSPSLDQHPPSANRYKTAYQTPQKPKKQAIDQTSTPARSS
jgi:septal ring factor EnvC (AmiA/AmiB activator)